MKKICLKRLLATGLALTLALGIVACGSASSGDTESGAASQDATVESSEATGESSDSAGTDLIAGTEAEASADSVEDLYSEEIYVSGGDDSTYVGSVNTKAKVNKALYNLLKAIKKNVQVGAAGSTLTAEGYAQDLVEWGTQTKSSNSRIKNTVSTYINSLSKNKRAEFREQLALVDEKYLEIADRDGTVAKVEVVMKKAKVR